MRVVLVMSQVNYVPKNYLPFLQTLLLESKQHVAGIIFLQNREFDLIKSIAALCFVGARKLSAQLLRNASESFIDPRMKLCIENRIPTLIAQNLNAPDVLSWLAEKNPDLVVNARTRCIYKRELLQLPRLGCINIHHGILPQYRGTMCDLYALSEGRDAGFSIHKMSEKLDDGNIIVAQITSHAGESDYLKHLERSATLEAKALSKILEECSHTDNLPLGTDNNCANIIYTKTPQSRNAMRAILRTGVKA